MRPILAFDLTNFTDSCINVTKAELAARFSGATNHLTYIYIYIYLFGMLHSLLL